MGTFFSGAINEYLQTAYGATPAEVNLNAVHADDAQNDGETDTYIHITTYSIQL